MEGSSRRTLYIENAYSRLILHWLCPQNSSAVTFASPATELKISSKLRILGWAKKLLASLKRDFYLSLFSSSSWAEILWTSIFLISRSSFLQWEHHDFVALDIATVQEWPLSQVKAIDLHLELRDAFPLYEKAKSLAFCKHLVHHWQRSLAPKLLPSFEHPSQQIRSGSGISWE